MVDLVQKLYTTYLPQRFYRVNRRTHKYIIPLNFTIWDTLSFHLLMEGLFFFLNVPAPPEIYPLPLPDPLPILADSPGERGDDAGFSPASKMPVFNRHA